MSFSSCYDYILGLPTATLVKILRGAISEGETAGVALTITQDDVPIADGLTADVEARVIDEVDHPASLDLTGVDLGVELHLRLRVEVTINEIENLDAIIYDVDFDLPGVFQRDTSEANPRLLIVFPGVTAADLGVVVSGGEITLSSTLIEQFVDDAIGDDAGLLGPNVETGVPVPPSDTAMITTEIYNDEPGSPGYRGHITGVMTAGSILQLTMPGHIKAQSITSTLFDTDMTITVNVDVEQVDGEIRVKLDEVQAADIGVTYATMPAPYGIFATPRIQDEVAARFQTFDPVTQTIPTDADVESLIEDQIVTFAGTLELPIFTPAPPGEAEDIDLTTFVPTTIGTEALALQLEPLGDATPCDAPDAFTKLEGFSLVISAGAVQPLLAQVVAENEGREREIQGHDVTVDSITATLHDADGHDADEGHIWIEGNADVEIDCWPDAGVEFWGPVYLSPTTDPDGTIRFNADTGNFGAEDDTSCEDVNPDDIAALIDEGQFTYGKLPTDFAGVGELSLVVTDVEIFSAGMILHGSFDLITLTALLGAQMQRFSFWAHEGVGGR